PPDSSLLSLHDALPIYFLRIDAHLFDAPLEMRGNNHNQRRPFENEAVALSRQRAENRLPAHPFVADQLIDLHDERNFESGRQRPDRKSTRLNSSHEWIS